MFRSLLYFVFLLLSFYGYAQPKNPQTSSDILLSLKKFGNVSSVLYIAAHPDDENTRLLAYLANDRCVRTGYLSLTRGDGGQNLIGDEQGVELGMIRTQELLAARKVDGAEQFFTRAFDFGFSKSPDEALSIWGHDKILADVVWVIRRFRPDVIITRFPTTGEGGHGHHTASAILAVEAIEAAADPKKFSEQFAYGVKPWKAQRLFWNTFNFGSVNTQREDQLKIDVGNFNVLMGQSYGEVAAKSRSQHKSQGFGVPAQRGKMMEYFSQLYGEKVTKDLLENVNNSWSRYGLKHIDEEVTKLIKDFQTDRPSSILPVLSQIRKEITSAKADSVFKQFKLQQLDQLISSASGLFLETVTSKQVFAIGDTVNVAVNVNSPFNTGLKKISVLVAGKKLELDSLPVNELKQKNLQVVVNSNMITQPYWLKQPMGEGSFTISDQREIGLAEKPSLIAQYELEWRDGSKTNLLSAVYYKHTDPVKGEIYEPVVFTYPLTAKIEPSIALFSESQQSRPVEVQIIHQGENSLNDIPIKLGTEHKKLTMNETFALPAGGRTSINYELKSTNAGNDFRHISLIAGEDTLKELHAIKYDHIPDLFYHNTAEIKSFRTNLVISGKKIGYINGAGDKVAEGLKQMGYDVTMLSELDVRKSDLSYYDAIITGVRAYNVHAWLPEVYTTLMQYVFDGGVLLVQYNTNSNLGPLQGKIGPYPFTISRSRITNEKAEVNFLNAQSTILNFPNKITAEDFDNWIQERSIYHAENIDANYEKLFSMQDPGEKPNEGSLIVANYGKGRFVYTGLVFFRELPAGVAGAYRLLANLLSKPQQEK